MHSTNYTNAFIAIAEDCKAESGIIPPQKQAKTIARMQYELMHENPYQFTSDQVIFTLYATRNAIEGIALEGKREEFFSKGQPCLRSSPLGKIYGWGIHFNTDSKIAIYACESKEYNDLKTDRSLQHLRAMRSSK